MQVDENRLRLIALVVIVGIGASYMLWLTLSYVQQMRTQEYIKNSVDKWFTTMPEPATGEVIHEPDVD